MKRITGVSIPRIDAADKVTGKALYSGDYDLPDMLHIKLIRATCAHAIIKSIDTNALNNLKDVYCFTAKDVYENSHGNILKDQPVLACDKVRFYGEPVAIIAAYDKNKLDEYAKLVKVDYEPLEIVDEPKMSILETSPKVHENGNLLQHLPFEKGDVDTAFKESSLILRDNFEVPVVDHLYLETEAGVSYMDDNGVLNLIVGTQNAFQDKSEIIRCFNIPSDKVEVRAGVVGGGFGGKDGNTVQLFLALVTWKTGKPAKLVFTREESLVTTYKRHAAKVYTEIGFTKEGLINAYKAEMYYDTGAYAALGPATLGLGLEHAAGPYVIPNVKLDGYLCYTNKAPASAMRGFGAPQVEFATEILLTRASKLLNIDPIELRFKNALYRGAEGSLGHTMNHAVGLKEALKILEDSPLWKERKTNKAPNIGYGMAAGYLSCGMGKGIPDNAEVEVEELPEQRYRVRIGTVEIGQGSSTVFAQIAAEELGVSVSQVDIIMADTKETHDCGSTAGSRTAYICGNALIAAIRDLKKKKEEGMKHPKGIGKSSFPEASKPDLGIGFPHSMYTFIAQAVKVDIDPFTGDIKVLDIFAVTEAGRILNPLSLDGQIHGGIAMGVGYCLTEEMRFIKGIPEERTLSTYLIPTSMDLPSMTSKTVDSYEDSGPQGLKGAAEVSSVAIAPAIVAAVSDVVPVEINELPISRHKIVEYFANKEEKTWDLKF